uniref:Uncharacterized protein n=1 Tax=Timema genevievae TaxID=629358 RepID=A0A7R9PI06_TIMGE|nr:unnamed protein product [Timema genevievae]
MSRMQWLNIKTNKNLVYVITTIQLSNLMLANDVITKDISHLPSLQLDLYNEGTKTISMTIFFSHFHEKSSSGLGQLLFFEVNDKMGEMCLMGYRFIILDGAFLVHTPSIKRRSDITIERTAWRRPHERRNIKMYESKSGQKLEAMMKEKKMMSSMKPWEELKLKILIQYGQKSEANSIVERAVKLFSAASCCLVPPTCSPEVLQLGDVPTKPPLKLLAGYDLESSFSDCSFQLRSYYKYRSVAICKMFNLEVMMVLGLAYNPNG